MENDDWILEKSVKILLDAAKTLEDAAKELRRDAEKLSETRNISYITTAANTIANIFQNLRLDLFVHYAARLSSNK
jgi:hypothetical protein